MVHDGEAQHTTPRCLGQGMLIIVLPRCLGVTSLRGHASRLGMDRNSLELRVLGERFLKWAVTARSCASRVTVTFRPFPFRSVLSSCVVVVRLRMLGMPDANTN